jgi:hypothetical protein
VSSGYNTFHFLLFVLQTFVATQDKKMTELLFNESICAFTCGKFIVDGQLKPVLFYVTFNGKIIGHYDFKVYTGKGSNRRSLKKGKIDRSERRLPGNFCLRCLRASSSKQQFFPF